MQRHGDARMALARRVREIRSELFGERGGPILAAALDLPDRTWSAYEADVAMPVPILLRFIVVCGVDPHWLLTGEGEKSTRRKYRLDAPAPAEPWRPRRGQPR